MKKLLLVPLVAMGLFAACKKDLVEMKEAKMNAKHLSELSDMDRFVIQSYEPGDGYESFEYLEIDSGFKYLEAACNVRFYDEDEYFVAVPVTDSSVFTISAYDHESGPKLEGTALKSMFYDIIQEGKSRLEAYGSGLDENEMAVIDLVTVNTTGYDYQVIAYYSYGTRTSRGGMICPMLDFDYWMSTWPGVGCNINQNTTYTSWSLLAAKNNLCDRETMGKFYYSYNISVTNWQIAYNGSSNYPIWPITNPGPGEPLTHLFYGSAYCIPPAHMEIYKNGGRHIANQLRPNNKDILLYEYDEEHVLGGGAGFHMLRVKYGNQAPIQQAIAFICKYPPC